jgi:hypothetical protein
MRYSRFLAPVVAALFSLYVFIWALVAQNYSMTYHIDAVFLGIMLALLAFLRLRFSMNMQPQHSWRDQARVGE